MNKELRSVITAHSPGSASTLLTAAVLVAIGMAIGAALMPAPLLFLNDPASRVLVALAAAALVGALLARLHLQLRRRRAGTASPPPGAAVTTADAPSRAVQRARERAAQLARERAVPEPAVRRGTDLDFLHIGAGHER